MRLSQAPRLIKCWPSGILCERVAYSENDAAETGTAFHACEYPAVINRTIDFDAITDVDIRVMASTWWKMWHNGFGCIPALKDFFEKETMAYEREVTCPVTGLVGHIDLSAWDDDTVYIHDLKTGRVDRDYSAQLMVYARALNETLSPPRDNIYTVMSNVKNGYGIVDFYTRDELFRKLEQFDIHVAMAMAGNEATLKDYCIGHHCESCNGAELCPAITQKFEIICKNDEIDLSNMSDDAIIEAIEVSSLIKRRLDEFDKAKMAVLRRRGILRGKTHEYTMTEVNKKDLIVANALPIIREYLTVEEIMGRISMSLTDLKAAIWEACKKQYDGKPPRGAKKSVEEDVMKRLLEADALRVVSYTKPVCKQIKHKENNDE